VYPFDGEIHHSKSYPKKKLPTAANNPVSTDYLQFGIYLYFTLLISFKQNNENQTI
jgi:hypothetical protein